MVRRFAVIARSHSLSRSPLLNPCGRFGDSPGTHLSLRELCF